MPTLALALIFGCSGSGDGGEDRPDILVNEGDAAPTDTAADDDAPPSSDVEEGDANPAADVLQDGTLGDTSSDARDMTDDGDGPLDTDDPVDPVDPVDTDDTVDTVDTDDPLDTDAVESDGGTDVDAADVDEHDSGGDVSPPAPTIVPVTLTGRVLFATNYPNQLHPLYRSNFTAGSAMARIRLFARFCEDAACERTLHVIEATFDGQAQGTPRVVGTAATSGEGLSAGFSVREAPLGATYLQLVGDPEFRTAAGRGSCATDDCPGALSVLQTDTRIIGEVDERGRSNPEPTAIPLRVERANAALTLPGTAYLGSIQFGPAWTVPPAAPGEGRFLVAGPDEEGRYRNTLFVIDASSVDGHPGRGATATPLIDGEAPFRGDLCGVVEGSSTLWVIGIDNAGAALFALDPTTGAQRASSAVARIPAPDVNNAESWPWPCRGVAVEVEGQEHLVLLHVRGAGSLPSSGPTPIFVVDPRAGTHTTPFAATFRDWALRSVVYHPESRHVIAYEMSWSLAATRDQVRANRLVRMEVLPDGSLGTPTIAATGTTSDDRCDSTLHWPTGLAMIDTPDGPRLVAGHEEGVTLHDPTTLERRGEVLLPRHGRLFSNFVWRADREELLALPQCKAITANSTFRLPLGAGDEASDSNLIAILRWGDEGLTLATTGLDLDEDGTDDDGIDIDYFDLKRTIRGYSSSLVIPPVVFTGPTFAWSGDYVLVRGSGIQGNPDTGTASSSGLGQASDLSLHDRRTGHGVILRSYNPFLDGPSGRWGLALRPDRESSTGFVHPLPAR